MSTKISDVIVPEVFNPYVTKRTMALSSIFSSGIITNDEEFDRLASTGAQTISMPYWNDLSNEGSEVLSDTDALTPGKIGASEDVAAILRRGASWGSNNLAANLAGSDPMKAIADLVAAYWARDMQQILLAILKGVFLSPTMASNSLDVSGKSGAQANFTANAFIDATQLLGDAKSQLSAIVMHSATQASLAKQNLIDFVRSSDGSDDVPKYMGKQVIVDDSCPVSGDVYTTYIFGKGAIALGNGNPVGFVATETDRDSLLGEDYLVNRKTFIMHPRGVRTKWTQTTKSSPTNIELGTASNWTRVYEPKQIRIVQLKHKLL